jgi:hypothetical protein
VGCYAVLELWASLRLHLRKPAIWDQDPCTNYITRNLPFLNAGWTFSVFADQLALLAMCSVSESR